MAAVFLVAVIVINNFVAIFSVDPLVETNVGLIRGLSSENNDFSMFLGVPYAQVNSSNPFAASTRYPIFEDTYDAYQESPMCPQVSDSTNQSLDCLKLNIYVPSNATSENQLPVMVWIHGGSFMTGSGSKDNVGPEFLVRHEVILVTVNYRLGVYGFMCLDHPEIPGNQGLKDQLLALRWVKENIKSFGGDVSKITLFGESAGGHSVELHLISEAEILYNNVILQSGSAEASTLIIEPDKYAPIMIAGQLDYTAEDVEDAINFLSSVSFESVVSATSSLGYQFKPCDETEYDGVEAFITKRWANAKIHKVANISVLIGFNDHELMLTFINHEAEEFESLSFITNINSTFNFDDDTLQEMSKYIQEFYIGDDTISEEKKWEIINYNSDFVYIHPIQRSINKFVNAGAGNIYYYMFSYNGGRNFAKVKSGVNETGVSHADDLRYLFNISTLQNEISTADQLIIDRMTTMWTNFAKYSNPTPETTELLPITWEPITNEKYNYLKIDTELSLSNRPYKERMTMWDLFYKLNEKHQKYYDERNL